MVSLMIQQVLFPILVFMSPFRYIRMFKTIPNFMKNQFYILLSLLILHALQSCGQVQNHSKMEKYLELPSSSSDSTLPKTEDEWKRKLSEEQYYILRKKGTESPFSGKFLLNKEKGIYKCAGCGSELFSDDMKFESHCGWPSFDREIAGDKIRKTQDNSHGMTRTEITCAKCGGHLGHIFDDGPTETGVRYCVNSLSLEFEPAHSEPAKKTTPSNSKIDTIVLGGGCFWCVEAVYEELDGVISVESGYSGGHLANPSYHQVSSGTTGHAEVTRIIYDNTKTSIDEIFKVFFSSHDPTTWNRQGADHGTQYRSVIFFQTNAQKIAAEKLIQDLNKFVFDGKIVTEVKPLGKFYIAEDYHQDYYANNKNQPYCQMVVKPKLDKFEKLFKDRLKK